jgi:uncharacterized protein
MEKLQIAITGAVGAGKTSFIRAISEIDVVDTERRATDETALLKSTTTVALDFGRVTLNSGQILYLYGTPGQFRFDFMWDIVIRKVDAYILLVDAHSPQYFRHSKRILSFMRQRTKIPMIIGLTHADCENAWQQDDIALALGMPQSSDRPIFVSVRADKANSVAKCLVVLVEQLIQQLTARS